MKKVILLSLKVVLLIFVIYIVYLVFLVAYGAFMAHQEDRLRDKAYKLNEGMRVEKVIEIMGKPKDKGIIDSDQMIKGWYSWENQYAKVKARYDKLLVLIYYVKRYNLRTFREDPWVEIIALYFDPVEQTLVYVSSFNRGQLMSIGLTLSGSGFGLMPLKRRIRARLKKIKNLSGIQLVRFLSG